MALEDHDQPESQPLQRVMVVASFTMVLYAAIAAYALSTGTSYGAQAIGSNAASTAATLLLAGALIALSTIDSLTFELPDALTLPLAAIGVLLHTSFGWTTGAAHLGAAVVGFAILAGLARIYHAARGCTGLGLGDAKLLAAAGAWLGIAALPSVLLLAAGGALVSVAIAGLRHGALSLSDRIPFGPYLAFAIWLVWLYGPITFGG